MKVVEFLKSLVFPRLMVKYKTMTALISLMLFILPIYLLELPYANANAKTVAGYRDLYPMLAIQEIPLTDTNIAILEEINDLGCAVNADGKLECEAETITIQNNEGNPESVPFEGRVFERIISFEKDGITKNIHFIIDYHKVDEVKLQEPYDLSDYPYQSNVEEYFIVLNRNYLYFQAFQKGLEEKAEPYTHNGNKIVPAKLGPYLYEQFFPEFRLTDFDEQQVKTMGNYLLNQLLEAEVLSMRSVATFFLSIFIFILPLVMIFLYWLFFKRQGQLKRFKEYFNIAALASIVPILLTFALAWVWPIVINYYIFGFAMYYLFVLYRINSMPEPY